MNPEKASRQLTEMDNTKTCVGAFLFRNGRVLLGLRSRNRSSYPGLWDAIGGHVKPSESLRDALIRELNEEIQVTPVDFFELAELPDLPPDTNGLVAYHIFLVTRSEERRVGKECRSWCCADQ